MTQFPWGILLWVRISLAFWGSKQKEGKGWRVWRNTEMGQIHVRDSNLIHIVKSRERPLFIHISLHHSTARKDHETRVKWKIACCKNEQCETSRPLHCWFDHMVKDESVWLLWKPSACEHKSPLGAMHHKLTWTSFYGNIFHSQNLFMAYALTIEALYITMPLVITALPKQEFWWGGALTSMSWYNTGEPKEDSASVCRLLCTLKRRGGEGGLM